MAPDDDRDRLHRGLHEKVEAEEELEDEEDFSDLVGETVENDRVASAAEAVRAQRQEQDDKVEDLDDLFVEAEAREFIDDVARATMPKRQNFSPADGDDEEAKPDKPDEIPVVEDEISPSIVGQSWLSSAAPPPAPTERETADQKNDWLAD